MIWQVNEKLQLLTAPSIQEYTADPRNEGRLPSMDIPKGWQYTILWN
jgi:hypothetical protein